jgi:hypothetical protein
MRKIINDPSRADITFVLEGGKVIHAHRCILLVRSRTLEDKVRTMGKRSDERDKIKWGINNPNHLVLEF